MAKSYHDKFFLHLGLVIEGRQSSIPVLEAITGFLQMSAIVRSVCYPDELMTLLIQSCFLVGFITLWTECAMSFALSAQVDSVPSHRIDPIYQLSFQCPSAILKGID